MSAPTKPRYVVALHGSLNQNSYVLCIETPLNPDGTPPSVSRLTKPVMKVTSFGMKQIDPHWAAAALNACDGLTKEDLSHLPNMLNEGTGALQERDHYKEQCKKLQKQRDELLAMFEEVVALGNHGDVNNSIKFKALAVRAAEERLDRFKKKHNHETPPQP